FPHPPGQVTPLDMFRRLAYQGIGTSFQELEQYLYRLLRQKVLNSDIPLANVWIVFGRTELGNQKDLVRSGQQALLLRFSEWPDMEELLLYVRELVFFGGCEIDPITVRPIAEVQGIDDRQIRFGGRSIGIG